MENIQSVFVLGRQPALGLAELESLYGSDTLQPITENVVACRLPITDISFKRLGGSVKFCKVLTILDTTNWKEIEKYLLKTTPSHSMHVPEGKLSLGISTLGLRVSVNELNATALKIKKVIRATGRPVRVVPNKEPVLSSAQVLHNKLTWSNGWELVLIKYGERTILAQNIVEQDIGAYAARDQQRPKRDTRVGMLPPKLAQIIINLAADKDKQIANDSPLTVLDPFCGTGVVLQEAALMGYGLYGSDIEPRMIDFSRQNLEWLDKTMQLEKLDVTLQTGDATTHQWTEQFDMVACEGYLGQPFSSFPATDKLNQVKNTCNLIMKGFLKNISEQIPSGTRLCVALPAWHKPNGEFIRLPLLDQLDDLGYNRMSFVHVREQDLLYYRPGQVVARELLVITRK